MADQPDDQNPKPRSQPIGSLTSRIVRMQQAGDGTPDGSERRPTPSQTGASVTKLLTRTGTRHGVHGVGTPRSSLPAPTAKLPAVTLQRDPAALLPPHVTSQLDTTWEINNTGYGWDGYVSGYALLGPLTETDLTQAVKQVENWLQPAPAQLILAELTRVRALTISRDQSTADLELVAAAYADELREYPVDVVREVLREWPRTHRFWPTLCELVERMEHLVVPRKALLDALCRGYREPEVSPDWIAPSPEDMAAVEEILAEHGYSIDHTGRVRPPEREDLTPEIRRRVEAETRGFKLLPENDPRVQARLREMEAEGNA